MKIKETFVYESRYRKYDDCNFLVGWYPNGNLGLKIWSNTEGPVVTVTTNTGKRLPYDHVAVKTYSENEGIDEFLKSKGIISDEPLYYIASGYVSIPVYKLTDKGKEFLDLD